MCIKVTACNRLIEIPTCKGKNTTVPKGASECLEGYLLIDYCVEHQKEFWPNH